MSFFKIDDDLRENFTLVTHPHRTFASSSATVTGSVRIYPRVNNVLKEVEPLLSQSVRFSDVTSFDTVLRDTRLLSGSANISAGLSNYLNYVNAMGTSARLDATASITRHVPGHILDKQFLRKTTVIDGLIPYYSQRYESSDFSFSNFNCLSFVTASGLTSDFSIIYPISYSAGSPQRFAPSSKFTVDFHVNPRRTAVGRSTQIKAGTIMHISSTIAISIVTGTLYDERDQKVAWRILLQLSKSADTRPSEINLSTANNARSFPNDLAFVSADNVLRHNTWSHVAIRWSVNDNHGTGSMFVDGQQVGTFYLPSSSILTSNAAAGALHVGNFFEGTPSTDQRNFFNSNAVTSDGVSFLAGTADPSAFTFNHPLNADIYGLRITHRFMPVDEIFTSSFRGQSDCMGSSFYVPVLFVSESRARNVLYTPFVKARESTAEPCNVKFMMTSEGKDVNVENFLREFVSGEYPRLYNLTSSISTGSYVSTKIADDYMYDDVKHKRRSFIIMPCDDGSFTYDYRLLSSGTNTQVPPLTHPMSRFVTDRGALDMRQVTLRNMITGTTLQSSVSGNLESEIYGASPDHLNLTPGVVPAVFQVTRDPSSNNVVMFNVPSAYYGSRIRPGTLRITDDALTGSAGSVSVTLRDDGHGNIYRADCMGSHARWASVGNVFYDEGVILIKHPSLAFFGKNSFNLSFDGETRKYVTRYNLLTPAGYVNSSSNPSFVSTDPSPNANDLGESFVYITDINVHDENMNVVARTRLAQPVIKRSSEKIAFRIKVDY